MLKRSSASAGLAPASRAPRVATLCIALPEGFSREPAILRGCRPMLEAWGDRLLIGGSRIERYGRFGYIAAWGLVDGMDATFGWDRD
jgi:hypothetical protein